MGFPRSELSSGRRSTRWVASSCGRWPDPTSKTRRPDGLPNRRRRRNFNRRIALVKLFNEFCLQIALNATLYSRDEHTLVATVRRERTAHASETHPWTSEIVVEAVALYLHAGDRCNWR